MGARRGKKAQETQENFKYGKDTIILW